MTNLIISANPSTGLAAYICQDTQDAFMTHNLLTDVSGMHNETLDRIVQSERVRNYASEIPESLTSGGIQGVRKLYAAKDLPTILNAWNPRGKEQKASKKALMDALIVAGATAYVYNLCGYTMQEVKPQVKQLQHTSVEYAEAHKIIEGITNETLKQLLRNQMIDELSVLDTNQRALNGNLERVQHTTVKVRATELGYSVQQIGNGSQLGKFVKKQIEPAFEERVGKYPTNHYTVSDDLDRAIHLFFS